jgi:hypothetical protein
MSKLTKLTCTTCGEKVYCISGVSAIWDRGYWWHTKCCSFFYDKGEAFVSFPSDGLLAPPSIMQSESPTP